MIVSSVSQVREAEQRTILSGVPGYELMCRAGRGAADIIEELFPDRKRTVILCGSGNNGGDALVVAALLKGKVIVYSTRRKEDFKGEAACAAKDLPSDIPFIVTEEFCPQLFSPGDLIVDGLLGIGFSGEKLRETVSSAVRAVNDSCCKVVSLDVPSGLNCDTGRVSDIAVKADVTITFGAVKKGLLCGMGPALCGILRTVDIGLNGLEGENTAVTFEESLRFFPRYPADIHKNRRGELLVVAGSCEYSGAAALTSTAALRCGSGLVRLATVGARKNIPWSVIVREYPDENGFLPSDLWQKIADFSQKSSALAAGPGWGKCSSLLLEGALQFPGSLILDADALNLLAENPHLLKKRENVVITPHPGEARRLAEAFGICETERLPLAAVLAQKLGAVVLLKGKFTIVSSPCGKSVFILAGSPALATAGSGDVLTGIIGSLLAAGIPPFEAAVCGASLHGRAGEIAGIGSIADDLPLALQKLLKEFGI